jgi:short-subunit dehydrogenase
VVNACRSHALRLRASERTGHILLTGSEHSLSSPEYLREMPLHLYNMTKHSVLSIGESMRAELTENGVGVSVLCPGPVMSGLNENSEQARPEELGAQPELNISRLDPATLSGLGDLYLSAADAAAIALRGIRAGAFVIPTHAFQRKDVDARYKEMVAGFDLLE